MAAARTCAAFMGPGQIGPNNTVGMKTGQQPSFSLSTTRCVPNRCAASMAGKAELERNAMSFVTIFPPDPDCPKCSGTGTWHESKQNYLAGGPCNCRRFENIKKVQDRCKHEFVCNKCQLHPPAYDRKARHAKKVLPQPSRSR